MGSRALVAAVSALALWPLAGSASAATDRCRTHEKVVLTSPRVEIWAGEPARICHRPTGRVTAVEEVLPIADPDVDDRAAARRAIDTGGDYVGYAWDYDDEECGYGGLSLMNARTGEIGYLRSNKCDFYTRFRRVVVRPSGAIAWGEYQTILVCRSGCEAARSQRSYSEVLARGRDVETRSLRETRTGIAWRERGRWRRERVR